MQDDEDSKLNSDALQRFTETWEKFDKDVTMFISTAQLPSFMRELPPPLGLGGMAVVSKEEMNALIGTIIASKRNSPCSFLRTADLLQLASHRSVHAPSNGPRSICTL